MTDKEKRLLPPPFSRVKECGWIFKWIDGGDTLDNCYRSKLKLFENGQPLPLSHQNHKLVYSLGRGRYSHWENRLYFSTSDNSDPNLNGRTYHVEFAYDLASWQEAVMAYLGETLWGMHPAANYFLSRGGVNHPPPLCCGIGLTNKCNLRCEICGSQKFLDETGTRRRHMPANKFLAVAEVLFPFMYEVELNSQGDPLLHPDIALVLETLAKYKCELKLQTNGTLFTDEIIGLLLNSYGTVNLSLDAVGSRFDKVRRGANWTKAEPMLLKFLKLRRADRLTVGVYPTVTRRTLKDAIAILDWSEQNGVDTVAFHKYIRIKDSLEEEPGPEELLAAKSAIKKWAKKKTSMTKITFDGESMNEPSTPVDPLHKKLSTLARFLDFAGKNSRSSFRERTERTEYASPEKRTAFLTFPRRFYFAPLETEQSFSDPLVICTAPYHYVEIGLEGQIGACCRAQDITLGYATSVEQFAEAWLGRNYSIIRSSLLRDATNPYPLPNCEECINNFAPKTGGGRKAVQYVEKVTATAHSLILDPGEIIQIESIQKEQGHCFTSKLPPGISPKNYELWEGDSKLLFPNTLHDEIRANGLGRYSVWGRSLYFSSADNSDPRQNERQYKLKRLGA